MAELVYFLRSFQNQFLQFLHEIKYFLQKLLLFRTRCAAEKWNHVDPQVDLHSSFQVFHLILRMNYMKLYSNREVKILGTFSLLCCLKCLWKEEFHAENHGHLSPHLMTFLCNPPNHLILSQRPISILCA